MSLTLTVVDHWEDTKRFHLIASLLGTGNYIQGGDTIILTNPLIKSGSAPIFATAQVAGYNLIVLPGAYQSSPASAKLQVFIDSTGLELAAGVYPAALQVAGAIQLYAIFFKHI